MEIKTKFDIGDTLFTLDRNDKAIRFTVKHITVNKSEGGEMDSLSYYNGDITDYNRLSRDENQLFTTPEDLRDSIFGELVKSEAE